MRSGEDDDGDETIRVIAYVDKAQWVEKFLITMSKYLALFFVVELVLHIFACGICNFYCGVRQTKKSGLFCLSNGGTCLQNVGRFTDSIVVPLVFCEEWLFHSVLAHRRFAIMLRLWRVFRFALGEFVLVEEIEESQEVAEEETQEQVDRALKRWLTQEYMEDDVVANKKVKEFRLYRKSTGMKMEEDEGEGQEGGEAEGQQGGESLGQENDGFWDDVGGVPGGTYDE
eukprot:g6837.t1